MFGNNPFRKDWATQNLVQESKFIIPEEIPANERTAFHGAAAAAAKAGKKSFNFGGKTHPVTMAKDTAHKIADQKEGYYKDQEIRRQDKEMGAKPVPVKKKKEAKNSGKEGDVEMNPKMDTAKKEGASKIRESLLAVLSEKDDRKKHNPNEDKAEKMKDNRKGKGAEDMMADADAEIAKGPDAHLNEPEIDKENFKKMTSNVKTAKKRNRDNAQGDMKIVPGGTQFKDPTAMKAEESVTKADDKQSGGFVHKESVSFAQSINNMRNAYASMYATEEENFEDLDEVYESSDHQLDEKAAIHPNVVNRLSQGIGLRGHGDQHNGHDGASVEHDMAADKHKGTAAGKLHAKAALHHSNASAALKKGNMTTSLKHAELARHAASKAVLAGGEASSSRQIHMDHKDEARLKKPLASTLNKKKEKSAARANPAKAVVGKAKSKVKSFFKTRKESVQEAKEGDWGTGTADNYTHHVKGYTGERGDPGHHAMLAKAKARNVKVTAGKSKEYMYGGKHIILRGKKKDVDHVIDKHIGRDE